MFGTDWPVCLLRIENYADWAATVRDLVASLSDSEREAILHANATRAYNLA